MTWPEESLPHVEVGAQRSNVDVGREARDCQLMEAALCGEADALDELLAIHWSAVVGYTRRLLDGDLDAAQDIAQEVFLRIWQRRIAWQPGGSLRAYLFGLARNLALNQRKSAAVRLRAVERVRAVLRQWSSRPTPHEELERKEARATLDRAIASLPPRRREVFILVRVHGLSYREVAEILRISPQTVANQMSSALSELRRMLRSRRSDRG